MTTYNVYGIVLVKKYLGKVEAFDDLHAEEIACENYLNGDVQEIMVFEE